MKAAFCPVRSRKTLANCLAGPAVRRTVPAYPPGVLALAVRWGAVTLVLGSPVNANLMAAADCGDFSRMLVPNGAPSPSRPPPRLAPRFQTMPGPAARAARVPRHADLRTTNRGPPAPGQEYAHDDETDHTIIGCRPSGSRSSSGWVSARTRDSGRNLKTRAGPWPPGRPAAAASALCNV